MAGPLGSCTSKVLSLAIVTKTPGGRSHHLTDEEAEASPGKDLQGDLEPRPAPATTRAAWGVSLTVLGHLQDVADQRAVPIEGLGPRQVDGPLLRGAECRHWVLGGVRELPGGKRHGGPESGDRQAAMPRIELL